MKLKVIGAISAVIILIAACQNEESIEFRRYYSSGALVYQSHCQNCHGENGEGLSALIPPLTDSNYLIKNKTGLACSIKSGLKGPITIKGKTFDDAMPANDLSPIEIAQVLTYIGNSFGNKLNTIDEQEVQTDLTKCK
ncbi:c-type cytochrome [Mucilaginibacter sp. McL0603]|uniref:c-type cytochrome n=1 Tax=Mucilaginibacter sp. McL0603 TaxID=3415670 RepID=UPI003CF73B13